MGRMLLLLLALSICLSLADGANITCATSGMWTCPSSFVTALSKTPPQRWYTLGTALKVKYAHPWIQDEGFCCRHCVWDLAYPLVDPIILASDRTSTMNPQFLDCTSWEGDFDALDLDNNGKLTLEEMAPWYTTGVNKFLVDQKRLSPNIVFSHTDFNLDGSVSKPEWYVLRHFWAPVALSKNGPLQTSTNVFLKDGPLGGLFWDKNLIEVFMADIVNVLLEQVRRSKIQDCADITQPCYWDSSYVREFNSREQSRVMRTFDLDGSESVSLEEHYFRHFADKNGDGVVSQTEYALSLYDQTSGSFANHDMNKDNLITFLERKFQLADRSPRDNQLSKNEWILADLPQYFGPFNGHKLGATVDKTGFTWYTILHTCALQGTTAYQVSLSDYPWSPECNILVNLQANEPWITASANSTSRRASTPSGSNYVLDMFNEAILRLKWNTTIVYKAAKPAQNSVKDLQMPLILGSTGQGFGTINVGLYSDWQPSPGSDYACSRSFAPELDGFSVVVRSSSDEVSLTAAVLQMVVGAPFINFASFLFLVLIAVGHIYWFLERNENSEQFNPSYGKGILDSAWFCIVTMSTVGYGDKVPATGVGKAITVIWMLFGILNFGIFTGQISSEINLISAEASIADVNGLGGFEVGIYTSSSSLKLDQQYQFDAVQCVDMKECSKMLLDKKVSALLVPTADVLTYFVKEKLASVSCGNPMRIVGPSVLSDQYPAVKMCSYSRSVYAATYLTNALNKQLDILEENGFAMGLRDVLQQQVTDTSLAASCEPGLEYDLAIVIPAAVTIFVYWLVISYINHRKHVAQGRAIRSFFGQTQKTPEQLALYYGLKWKSNAKKFAKAREMGKDIQYHSYKPALSHDDRLLNFLKRVRVLSAGHAYDLRRCQKDADALHMAVNLANSVMGVTVAILFAMLAGIIYSLYAVINAQPRYMRLEN